MTDKNSAAASKTAEISNKSSIGKNTKIWHFAQIREGARIGNNCVIGKSVYIDHDVVIGDNVKIQNNVSIFYEAILEDGVFVGPHVCFTNDKAPRAINRDGVLKDANDWNAGKIVVKKGASIGANSTVLPDVTIGKFSMIGAGSVVTKDVPDNALAFGNPAELRGYVCYCGNKLDEKFYCKICKSYVRIEGA